MKETKFSIIIPVYNTKIEYIQEAIESALNVDYNNYELMLIDDGSNEEVKQLLDKYESRCNIYHQVNQGFVKACLNGINKAKGEYILFLDFDDCLNKTCLSKINVIINEYNADIVTFNFARFSNSISDLKTHNSYFKEGIVNKEDAVKQLCLLHTNPLWCRCAKKSLYDGIDKIIDANFKIGDDVQFSSYVVKNAKIFYHIDEIFYYYRCIPTHREYYDISNVEEFNFLVPVYNYLFSNKGYDYALPYFKKSAVDTIIYNTFRICLWIKDNKKKKQLLDDINNIEITKICNSLKVKISPISSFLYLLLIKKHYIVLSIMANIYNLIFGMQVF